MIESDPIPAGENNFIKICLDDTTYRIRFTDLFGNIFFELEKNELFRFNSEFNFKLVTIQELMAIDQKRETILQAAKIKQSINNAVMTTTNTNLVDTAPATSNDSINQPHMYRGELTGPLGSFQRSLELVPIHPPLSSNELAICIRAMKERQKLSEKVTIDDDDNLEQFILQVFSGERITVNKIINKSADHSISLLAESLGRTLERMVQEGKITSTKAKIKDNGHEYTLYAINYIPDKANTLFNSLLAKLDSIFTVNSFITLAKENDIKEDKALQMLEQSNSNGDILLDGPDTYRKLS